MNRADIVQRQWNYAPPEGDSEILGLEVAGTVAVLAKKSLKANAIKTGTKILLEFT